MGTPRQPPVLPALAPSFAEDDGISVDSCCGRPSTLEHPWGDAALSSALYATVSTLAAARLFTLLTHEPKTATSNLLSTYDSLLLISALLASITGAALIGLPSWAPPGADALAVRVGTHAAWWSLFNSLSVLLLGSMLKAWVMVISCTAALYKGPLGESAEARDGRVERTRHALLAREMRMVPLFSLPLVFLAISIVLLFCWQASVISIWASPLVAAVYCGVFIAAVSIFLLICIVAFTRLHRFSEAVKASAHPAPGLVHVEAAHVELVH